MSQNMAKRQRKNEETVSEDHFDELLPGIPSHIALEMIATKLPWRIICLLSARTPAWQQATRDHLVYNARVRSHATEKFFVLVAWNFANDCLYFPIEHTISLYSLREDSWCRLAPIPGFRKGIPFYCQCVSLNGAIYVLGGTKNPMHYSGRTEVYVLDLAGQQSQWRQCASMQKPRVSFAAGVMDGKIFALGGVSGGRSIAGCEVYDPKVDTWTAIEPTISCMGSPNVSVMGKELFVYGDVKHLVEAGGEDGAIDPDEEYMDEQGYGVGDASFNTLSGPYFEAWLMSDFRLFDEEPDDDFEVSVQSDIQLFNQDETNDDDAENQLDYLDQALANELINRGEVHEFIERQKTCRRVKDADFVEAYDPVNNVWRVVERLERDNLDEYRLPEPRHFITVSDTAAAYAWTIGL